MEKEGLFEIPIFRTSASALKERRLLFNALRLTFSLILLSLPSLLPLESGQLLAWAAAAALCLALWLLPTGELFARFATRELRLMDGTLEERRGRYARFLTYEQLLQLKVFRNLKEEIKAIAVLGEQGTLVLRGYDNMEILFAELAARRPETTLIEIEDSRYDKGSPLYWAALALILGIVVFILAQALSRP